MQVFLPNSFENLLSISGILGRPYSVLQPSVRFDGRIAKCILDFWNWVGSSEKPKSKIFVGCAAPNIDIRFDEGLPALTNDRLGGARKACGSALTSPSSPSFS